ncbi:hypothetical protein GCM10008957_35740 [Deinococcus ruber]|uniref:Bacterial transcriptional activator domain-containing protein n=1 Tax=Deinococcus ruber TaxID=1848197 RepID=A0A918CF81_9DEIO|nr:hypothetical protein GCM10008957_35740 [Deinococcus ruber]
MKLPASSRQHLEAAAEQVRTALNTLIRTLRARPDEVPAPVETPLPFPPGTFSGLIRLATPYARHARGGVRGGVTPLCPPLFRLDLDAGQVHFWTPAGDVVGALALGNYQRHLLAHSEAHTAHLVEARSGELYLRFALDAAEESSEQEHSSSGRAGPLPDLDRVAELEREGQYQQLAALLAAFPAEQLSPREQARLALSEWFVQQSDDAELKLLRLQGQADADARVMLGLSVVLAHRNDQERRLQAARQGLANEPDSWTLPYLLCCAGRALVELGKPEEALEEVERALACTDPQDLLGRARCLYYLQGVHATLEQFDLQERHAREALRLFELLGVRGEQLSLLMDLAYRRFYSGDLEEAQRLIEQAVDETRADQRPSLPTALLLRAEFSLLQQALTEAERDLTEALHLETAWHQDRLSVVLQAYLLECRWRAGTLTLDQFEFGALNLRPLSRFDWSVVHFYRGLIWLLDGELEFAERSLREAAQGVALLDSFRVRAEALLLEVARRTGTLTERSHHRLLELLQRVGGDLALEIDRELLSPLYTLLAERQLGGNRLARLAPSAPAERVLDLKTLGEFTASIGNDTVQIRLAKGRELLVWLALHGAATRDELQTALWDGQQSSGLGSYFKQALRSIRDALSPYLPGRLDAVTLTNGRYALNEQLRVQLDVLRLTGPDEAAALQVAVNMNGSFLPGADTEWVAITDQRARVAARERLLEQAERATEPAEAARWFTRMTELDPADELAWQELLSALERAGDVQGRRRALTAGRLAFSEEFGVVPDFLE